MPKPYGATAKGKIEYWIKQQSPGHRFYARVLHWELFRYKVSRGTINYALRELAANNLIERCETMRGRNSTWIVL